MIQEIRVVQVTLDALYLWICAPPGGLVGIFLHPVPIFTGILLQCNIIVVCIIYSILLSYIFYIIVILLVAYVIQKLNLYVDYNFSMYDIKSVIVKHVCFPVMYTILSYLNSGLCYKTGLTIDLDGNRRLT